MAGALGERHTNEPDLDRAERPFYALMMFPYPSAEGLHVGNLFAFTGNDIYGRFQRLQGHDVFEPMGYDAFGIHSENYALKVGDASDRADSAEHRELPAAAAALGADDRLAPRALHHRSVPTTSGRSGSSCSCTRRAWRTRRRRAVNWCPTDKTVLANEQVIAGACERCGTQVEQRFLEQWFFRITDYAERLLDNLDDASKIGLVGDHEADGAAQLDRRAPTVRTCDFATPTRAPIRVFTTRPDTIFGATYMVLAPEHPLVDTLTAPAEKAQVDAYRTAAAQAGPGHAQDRRQGEDRRLHRRVRDQPRDRRSHSDLDRRLRADGVRHRRDHGGAGHDERDFEFATRSSCRSCAWSRRRATTVAAPLGAAASPRSPARIW